MRLGVYLNNYGTGDPIDGDGYPKSRMPYSPPEMYHFSCGQCGKIWWDADRFRSTCPFCYSYMPSRLDKDI